MSFKGREDDVKGVAAAAAAAAGDMIAGHPFVNRIIMGETRLEEPGESEGTHSLRPVTHSEEPEKPPMFFLKMQCGLSNPDLATRVG